MAGHCRTIEWVESLGPPESFKSPKSLTPKSFDSGSFLHDSRPKARKKRPHHRSASAGSSSPYNSQEPSWTPPSPPRGNMADPSTSKQGRMQANVIEDNRPSSDDLNNNTSLRRSVRNRKASSKLVDNTPSKGPTKKRKASNAEPKNSNTSKGPTKKRKASNAKPMRKGDDLAQESGGQPAAKKQRRDKDSWTNLPLLEVPVYVRKWDEDALSASNDPYKIGDLEIQMDHQMMSREPLYPKEVRSELTGLFKLVGDAANMFRTEPLPKEVMGRKSNKGSESYAKWELSNLKEIHRISGNLTMFDAYESGWCSGVYEPILRHVFNDEEIEVVNIASAKMEGDSVPMVKNDTSDELEPALSLAASTISDISTETHETTQEEGEPARTRTGAKIVDLVLALQLSEESNLHQEIFRLVNRFANNKSPPHVNQTSDSCVNYSPIAVSIEAKSTSSSVDRGQLGVWTAGWYKRMKFLRGHVLARAARDGSLSEDEENRLLIPVPLISTTGPLWNFYFAFFHSDSITVRGPMATISTNRLHSIYVLVAWLRAVKEWIEKEFKKGMHQWFMVPEDGAKK